MSFCAYTCMYLKWQKWWQFYINATESVRGHILLPEIILYIVTVTQDEPHHDTDSNKKSPTTSTYIEQF